MMDPEHSDDGGAKSSIKIMFTRVRHGEKQYQSSGMARTIQLLTTIVTNQG